MNYLITSNKAVYSTAQEQAKAQSTIPVGPVYEDVSPVSKEEIELNTVEPLYNGHHWGMRFWPL